MKTFRDGVLLTGGENIVVQAAKTPGNALNTLRGKVRLARQGKIMLSTIKNYVQKMERAGYIKKDGEDFRATLERNEVDVRHLQFQNLLK